MQVASDAASAVKAVVTYAPGRQRKKAVGSAFVVRGAKNAFVVTAHHVLEQAPRPLISMLPRASVRWPESYWRVVAREGVTVPDCDISFYEAEVLADDLTAFRPVDLYPNYTFNADHRLIAVGHPVSRAKFGADPTRLDAPNAMIVGDQVHPDRVAELGFDPRTHLGIEYDQKERVDVTGAAVVGPEPWGMSGGALLAPVEQEVPGADTKLGVMVVGILVAYCKPPDSVMIAARIDCLLDAVRPFRPPSEQLYEARAV